MTNLAERARKVVEACPSCWGTGRMWSAVDGSGMSEPCPHRIHAALRELVEDWHGEACHDLFDKCTCDEERAEALKVLEP